MAKKLTDSETVNETPAQRKKRDLRDTLLGDSRIKFIYFDKAGNHFFRSFQAENGKRYSRFHVEYAKDIRGQSVRFEKPLPENEIVESISAEDWLKKYSEK